MSGCGPAAGQRDEPGCDPGLVFELADGSLAPEEARPVRRHLEGCPNCRRLYERERALSQSLRSADYFDAPRSATEGCAVHRAVAMALPTRRPLARLLWAVLAAGVLVWAVLFVGAVEAMLSAVGALAAIRGLVSSAGEVSRAVLAAFWPGLLVILAVGAAADLLIACGVLLARRARARQRRPGRA